MGPIQTWIDLIAGGVDPRDVRVLGINGGELSAFEFRLAAALGATIGLVEHSGRAASKLLNDPFWGRQERILPLPLDSGTFAAFVNGSRRASDNLNEKQLNQLARIIHEDYVSTSLKTGHRLHPSMRSWEDLDASYKESNISQAMYAEFILRSVGYRIVPKSRARRHPSFRTDEFEKRVEDMAELEHGRYMVERLSSGWRQGPDDPAAKKNPSLISWEELPDGMKRFDRIAVKNFPRVLSAAGFAVVPGTVAPPSRRSPKKASRS
jgi:hypothetical protein